MGQFQRMFKLWRSGRGFSAGGNFQIDHGGRCAGITRRSSAMLPYSEIAYCRSLVSLTIIS